MSMSSGLYSCFLSARNAEDGEHGRDDAGGDFRLLRRAVRTAGAVRDCESCGGRVLPGQRFSETVFLADGGFKAEIRHLDRGECAEGARAARAAEAAMEEACRAEQDGWHRTEAARLALLCDWCGTSLDAPRPPGGGACVCPGCRAGALEWDPAARVVAPAAARREEA